MRNVEKTISVLMQTPRVAGAILRGCAGSTDRFVERLFEDASYPAAIIDPVASSS